MGSSQNAQDEIIEHSIDHLLKSLNRRKKWRFFFLDSTHPNQDLDTHYSSWRTHLIKFLDSSLIRLLTIFILLCDIILTVLELSSTLLSCSMGTKVGELEGWYHWASISLLGLLCVRSMGLAVGLGGSFFRRPGYIVDGVVTLVALALEFFFERKGGGLLVTVSLWRVFRIVESAFEISDEAIEAQIGVIMSQFEVLKNENMKLMEGLVDKDKIIQELQEQFGILS
ncbi:uncharacterized protein LOC124934521 [Impatiens glandulifera]|uniref:uncharacterized protein LOC124934521 n=1 Tax=Impatiens glandulifera TaxID=253017 RepID=UPI001FB08792|nr:uncharacterized protein LOC124934521 [Impatiens glandulifera]